MSPAPERIEILGIPLDCITMEGAVARTRQFLESSEFHLIVTLGTEMIQAAQFDPTFSQTVRAASLVIPDSIGPVLAARLHRFPVSERVAGVDLISRLSQDLGPQLRIFFLGAAPGVAEAAAAALQSRFPHITVAGSHDGYFQDDAGVVAQIRASEANVVLAALGFPRQENWLLQHGPLTGARVGVGVGGSFDVLAGRVQRAPRWMQRTGLEWLHRLSLQPSRWRRMLALPRFAVRVLLAGKQGVRPLPQRKQAAP